MTHGGVLSLTIRLLFCWTDVACFVTMLKMAEKSGKYRVELTALSLVPPGARHIGELDILNFIGAI